MRVLALIILFAIVVNAFDSLKQSGNLARIARGNHATIGQFSYTVRMHVHNGQSETLCGAALIGPSWLLTAAHCFDNAKTVIDVYLGSIVVDVAEVAYTVPVTSIVLHPRYNRNNLNNDIALLKIPPTDLCDGIGIVPLPKIKPSYSTYETNVAKASGWGITNDQHTLPGRLHWGRMKILRNEECEVGGITVKELCTATSSDYATICVGDSGGPLVLESTGELVGVASSLDAEDCERGGPAFFTRVTSYLGWIESVSGIFYE